MKVEILQKENKILRQKSREVSLGEITTPKIKNILKEMSSALKSQNDGVAIAAPQIGYSLRIFLVSGKIFNKDFIENRNRKIKGEEIFKNEKQNSTSNNHKQEEIKDIVFINPKIIKLSHKKEWLPEGCLSVRPLYGKTYRSQKATVTAYDENGVKFTRGGSGLLAQIFQHETDHLNGILFIDHAKEIKEECPEEN